MSVLKVQDLSVSFGERELFSGASFEVEQKDKIGFIGLNGAGKTTLLRIISGEVEPQSGGVYFSKDISAGYMEQHACSSSGISVYNELLSVFSELTEMDSELERLNIMLSNPSEALDGIIERHSQLLERFERLGGLTYKSRTRAALAGLGFTESEFDMPTEKLSGGQRSKLSLAKLLLSKANLLLLDEPTNHLDIASVSWLEGFIRGFDGAMIIISHDRYFLDAVTNKTLELENCRIRSYKGNYSEYMRKKKQVDDAAGSRYKNDLKEIKRIEGIIEQQRRFNQAHNYVTAASKQKEIDRIRSRLAAPVRAEQGLSSFRLQPKRESGNDVLFCKDLSKSFGGRLLFSKTDIHLRKGEKVFLLGANGCGKTTLLRIISGEIKPDSGTISFGAKVDAGYFDQMQGNLDLNETAVDWIWNKFPQMTQTRVRTALGSFLFRCDDVNKPIASMSGGERARLALLELMLRGDNLLLLDEPTNHLDTASREALEEALKNYGGTMLLVSHDRYFINKLADRVLVLTQGGLDEYLGNYDFYIEKINAPVQMVENAEPSAKPRINEYKLQKERQAEERRRKSRLKKIEEEISAAEIELEKLGRELQSEETASDYKKLLELTEQTQNKQAELDELYEQWSQLA